MPHRTLLSDLVEVFQGLHIIFFIIFLCFWPTTYATKLYKFSYNTYIVKIQSVYVEELPKIVSYGIKLNLSEDSASLPSPKGFLWADFLLG